MDGCQRLLEFSDCNWELAFLHHLAEALQKTCEHGLIDRTQRRSLVDAFFLFDVEADVRDGVCLIEIEHGHRVEQGSLGQNRDHVEGDLVALQGHEARNCA
jgi:hypothetical protein